MSFGAVDSTGKSIADPGKVFFNKNKGAGSYYTSPNPGGPVLPGNQTEHRLSYSGEFLTNFGWDLQNKSLSSMDALDQQLSNEVANGGLPPEVAKAFRVGQGAITDTASRANSSWQANLAQQVAAGGGRLDPGAALAYQLENEKNVNQSTFDARNQLSTTQAMTTMQHTNDLRQMILDIRSKELGTSTAMTTLGISAQADALGKGGDGKTGAYAGAIASIIGAVVSSRELKRDVSDVTEDEAMVAVAELQPIHYTYKANGEKHLGFIAEDVPELVATADRKSLFPMDVVAALTKVVQAQQRAIAELAARLGAIETQ